MDFKLLAIRPLLHCHSRFLKNLVPGQLYPLYNDHVFYDDQGDPAGLDSDVVQICSEPGVPRNLYHLVTADRQALAVNISAIAGKNGSGKSTLVELLFAAVYAYSLRANLLEHNESTYETDWQDLQEKRKSLASDLSYLDITNRREQLTAYLAADPRGSDGEFDGMLDFFEGYFLTRQKITEGLKKLDNDIVEFQKNRDSARQFIRDLKAELYFQSGTAFYRLTVDQEQPHGAALHRISELPGQTAIDMLTGNQGVDLGLEAVIPHFFYTIAVNYSHYALNSRYTGRWINALFHKNDAYKTPLVINPMRNEGNFNINDEIMFARYRLLSNLMIEKKYQKNRDKHIKLTDKQFVANVVFTLNPKKVQARPVNSHGVAVSGEGRSASLLLGILGAYFPGWELADIVAAQFPLKNDLINYIVQKVDRITDTYDEFRPGYQYGPNANELQNQALFEALAGDQTHITYKLDQAVNFLYRLTQRQSQQLFQVSAEQLADPAGTRLSYSLESLLSWIGEDIAGERLIEHLPPPIFYIDFELKTVKNPQAKGSKFTDLSSGEQQSIHCIQSVIYHLHNIQSAHLSKDERARYQSVNIIYDEIELYFHPAYQRSFISELLKALKRIHTSGPSGIKAVNILFLTHSPFILSDIPGQQILLLETNAEGAAVPKTDTAQTFAANINDLLADSFFLEGSLMGSFAEAKVDHLIKNLKKPSTLSAADQAVLNLIGDSFLKSSLNHYLKSRRDQNRNQ